MKTVMTFLKYAGVACIPIYIVLTFVSHLYNADINPLTNWLSDYGNPVINPDGALFYNLGCIAVAVLLTAFYIGMYRWYKNRNIELRFSICYICAQISGIAASVFLVLAAVVPLGTNSQLHGTFSTFNMIGVDLFLSFLAVAFFLNRYFKKWIPITMYISVVFNIISMNAFSSFYISEWIFFILFMIYLVVITLNYDKIISNKTYDVKQKAESSYKTI